MISAPSAGALIVMCGAGVAHYDIANASFTFSAYPVSPSNYCADFVTLPVLVGSDMVVGACIADIVINHPNIVSYNLTSRAVLGPSPNPWNMPVDLFWVKLLYDESSSSMYILTTRSLWISVNGGNASAVVFAPSQESSLQDVALSADRQTVIVSCFGCDPGDALVSYRPPNWSQGTQLLSSSQAGAGCRSILTGRELAGSQFSENAVLVACDSLLWVQAGTNVSVLTAEQCAPWAVDQSSGAIMAICEREYAAAIELGPSGPLLAQILPASSCAPGQMLFDVISRRMLVACHAGAAGNMFWSFGGVSVVPLAPAGTCAYRGGGVRTVEGLYFSEVTMAAYAGCPTLTRIHVGQVQPLTTNSCGGQSGQLVAGDATRRLAIATCNDSLAVYPDVLDPPPLNVSLLNLAPCEPFPNAGSPSYQGLFVDSSAASAYLLCSTGVFRINYLSGALSSNLMSGNLSTIAFTMDPSNGNVYVIAAQDSSAIDYLVVIPAIGPQRQFPFSINQCDGISSNGILVEPVSARVVVGCANGDGGVMLIDPTVGTLSFLPRPCGSQCLVCSMAVDHDGDLWVSYSDAGVFRFSGSSLYHSYSVVSTAAACAGALAPSASGLVYLLDTTALSVSALSTSSFVCPDGFFWWNNGCEACPRGTARNVSSPLRFQCEPCATGFVAPLTGSVACSQCTAGKYAVAAESSCLPCSLGAVSLTAASSCSFCVAGRYVADPSTCRDCTVGRYSFGLSSACALCDAGWISNAVASHCTPCGAGRFRFNASYCDECGNDEYSGVAAMSCAVCPVGRFAGPGSLDCSVCAPGTERNSSVADAYGCRPCVAGKFATGSGALCAPCEDGWTSPAAASFCLPCAAGRFRFNASDCVECAENQFSGVAASVCSGCSAGQFSARGSLFCTVCPGGSAANANETVCSACSAGRFALNSPCLDCVPGTVSNSSAGACVACAPGSSANSTAHPWPCDLCAAGHYTPTAGSPVCVPCPAGYVQALPGQTACHPCPIGFSTKSLSGQLACTPCDSYLYSNAPGSAACSYCPTHVQDDHTSCSNVTNCLANYELTLQHECVPCGIGSASYGGGKCSPCLPGTFTPYLASGCQLLDGEAGVAAPAGLLTVQAGWWMWISTEGNGAVQLHGAKCPLGYCAGAQLQSGSSGGNASGTDIRTAALHQCAYPRADFNTNYLCAQCADGYREWGSECLQCSGTHAGFLVLAFLMLLALTLVLMLVTGPSSSASGLLTITLYCGQTALLEVGSLTSLLSWLHFLNFDAQSVGVCLAHWNAYEQMMAALCVPIVMIAQLAGIAAVQRGAESMVNTCFRDATAGADADAAAPSRAFQFALRVRAWGASFNGGRYLAVALQILIFCFNRTAVTCVNYFTCVEVADARRVFAWPTLDCSSSTYRAYLIVVCVFFSVIVCGLPLILSYLLWRYHEVVFAHTTAVSPVDQAVTKPSRSGRREESQCDPDARHQSAVSPLHARLMGSCREDSGEEEEPEADLPVVAVEPRSLVSLPAKPSGTASLLMSVLLIYHRRAWFWPAVQLIRRVIFVTLNVALSSASSEQYFSYLLLHFASLLLHLMVQPFASSLLNRCECISLLMLTILSMLLTAFPSPYSRAFEVLLFLLVVPTLAGFLVLTLVAACRSLRRRFQSSAARRHSFHSLGVNHTNSTLREMNTRKNSKAPTYEPPQSPLRDP